MFDSYAVFGSGDGTVELPYIIGDIEELQAMDIFLDAHYRLSNDIDASGTTDWYDGKGFNPIGSEGDEFTGTFDGFDHIITGLHINRPTDDHVGVFGVTDSIVEIKNVGLIDATITGSDRVGGLVGENSGYIEKSYVTGTIFGNNRVAGLVGENAGSIERSYTNGCINGNNDVGGLVGRNINSGTIDDSYANACVNGNDFIGGLVGYNFENIEGSYSTGNVNGNDYVGGLVGLNDADGVIMNTYSIGEVYGNYNTGGLIGENIGIVDISYWNIETSGLIESSGGYGDTTENLTYPKSLDTFNFDSNLDWEYHPSVNNGYPYIDSLFESYQLFENGDGTTESPYEISTVEELQAMEFGLDKHYILVNDIDASVTETWDNGQGFTPIGYLSNEFTGTFDGQGFEISDLYINRSNEDGIGLFGTTNSGAEISNIGLINVNIMGRENVGALVGWNKDGTIDNSFSTGIVQGVAFVGGLVGSEGGMLLTIKNSYSTCDVSGDFFAGGLVGMNAGLVKNSYATGDVNGIERVGGLVGMNEGHVENSYANGDVNGIDRVGGLVGMSEGYIEDSHANGDVFGDKRVGGLVGMNVGFIENSYATGKIFSSDIAGGLVGINMAYQDYKGEIINSHATGDIIINFDGDLTDDIQLIGGLVGHNMGNVTDSEFIGNIDISINGNVSTNKITEIGGLIGYNEFGNITNSHSNGEMNIEIIGNHTINSYMEFSRIGGFIGYNDDGNVDDSSSNVDINIDINGFMDHSYIRLIGGFIGENDGDISNSYSKGSLNLSVNEYLQNAGISFIGGFIGVNGNDKTGGDILNSNSSFDINLEFNDDFIGSFINNVGGFSGVNFDGDINDTYSDSKININILGDEKIYDGNIRCGIEFIGGHTGFIVLSNENINIVNSYSTGDIGINILGDNSIKPDDVFYIDYPRQGVRFVGGFAGLTFTPDSELTNVFSTGDVIISSNYSNIIGGLVGYSMNSFINESFSTGNVQGGDYVGGLVGVELGTFLGNTIYNSHSSGDVIGNNSVGGLVGIILDGGNVTNSYSIGNVVGSGEDVGGLVGNKTDGTILSSYWDIDTSGQTIGVGNMSEYANVTGISTSNMKQVSTFEPNWNFTNVWNIDSLVNDGYPYLLSMYDHYEVLEPKPEPKPDSSSSMRSSVSPPYDDADNIEHSASSSQRVIPGRTTTFNIVSDDVPVTEISFNSKRDEGRVISNVQTLRERPANVPESTGKVYSYLNIGVGRSGTINQDTADNILIYFRVSKDWVEQENIDETTIRKEKYENGAWNRLPTEQTGEDDRFYYFVAENTGFSIFSINGDELAGDVVSEPKEEPGIESEPLDDTVQGEFPVTIILIALLMISVIALVGIKYKNR